MPQLFLIRLRTRLPTHAKISVQISLYSMCPFRVIHYCPHASSYHLLTAFHSAICFILSLPRPCLGWSLTFHTGPIESLRHYPHYLIMSKHRRGPWVPEEDKTLLSLVRNQGPNNWVRISQHMNYRSPKQCRERFHQNLKSSLNHELISPEEGEVIERMVNEMGKRWAEIARRLGNRSDNAVKNWWNGSMNRRRRTVIQDNEPRHATRHFHNRSDPLTITRPQRSSADLAGRRQSYAAQSNGTHLAWDFPDHGVCRSGPAPPSRLASVDDGGDTWTAQTPAFASRDSQRVLREALVDRSDCERLPTFLVPLTRNGPSFSASTASPCQRAGLSPLEPHASYTNDDQSNPRLAVFMTQGQFESPLVSPALSEVSHAPSMERAPSLVSDHNSNSSVSPKTAHSPRPDVELPAPVDTRSRAWTEQQGIRRGSAPNLQIPGSGFHGDEGYVCALPPPSAAEDKMVTSHLLAPPVALYPIIRRSDSEFSRQQYPAPQYTSMFPPPVEPSPVEGTSEQRDTRMNFTNLLN